VESWHTGTEWIDGGALVRRVNFAANLLGDVTLPGVQSIIGDLRNMGPLDPGGFVNGCLDLVGPMEVSEATRAELLDMAREGGDLLWDTEANIRESEKRAGVMLALIAASRDYQFA
jgi:hypothetical protein